MTTVPKAKAIITVYEVRILSTIALLNSTVVESFAA
jgi:hypothetical protein